MKLKALLLGCALSVGALPGGALLSGVACASSGPSAVLVVDTGSGVTTLCVQMSSETVSGTKLLQLAGAQHGLQSRIESGAVCQIAGTGPAEGDCFGDYPNFWGYWRSDGGGDWTWSSAGAATTTVESGDVEGWSWGSGSDGSSHRQPPATRYDAVCESAAPDPGPGDELGNGGGTDEGSDGSDDGAPGEGQENDDSTATTEGAAENDSAEAGGSGDNDDAKRKKKRKRGANPIEDRSDDEVSPADDTQDAEEADPKAAPSLPAGDEADGPPLVGLAGLGAALLFGGAGALIVRRRRSR